jgi:Rha family phage regulatory protein
MNDLVKAKNGMVFTNSMDVFRETGKTHAHVVREIEKLKGHLTIQKRQVKQYFIESSYINSRNREYKTYDMTRDGFILLAVGYNKEKFFAFKLKFIDAFNAMESELKKIHVSREIGKETRKVLTDIVKDSGENERMHGHGFSTYTRLAYKLAGINYFKCPGTGFRDSLTTGELDRVENIESMMKSLIRTGKQYTDIKNDLSSIFTPLITQ